MFIGFEIANYKKLFVSSCKKTRVGSADTGFLMPIENHYKHGFMYSGIFQAKSF